MEHVALSRQLASLRPVFRELRAFRRYLDELSAGWQEETWFPVKWIDDALAQMEMELYARRLTPVWWRFIAVDSIMSILRRDFHHADNEHGFRAVDSMRAGFVEGQTPERDHIMAWLDRIGAMYESARRRGR